MTLNQKKENDIILQKKNTLMQLWISMKQSIFDVLFVVLDKAVAQAGHITIVSLIYQSGFDYIQMMQFPFNFTIILVWNGGETLNSVFQFLSTVVSINTLMPNINYNAFLITLYLVIFMIVLIIIDIIYVSYSFTKKKFRFTLPLVLLAQIVPLFVTFLFIPVFEFLLNVINCSPSDTDPNINVMQFFPDIQCFKGTHIIHASITLFFTALFVFISTVVAMTLFQPRITGNTIASRRSSDGEIIFIINKIVCQFFLSLTPFTQTWPYIFLMFFPALWLFYFYQFKQPYYNKNVGKLYRIFSSYYFWTVLMLTISQIGLLLNFNFQGSMVIWFCGLPFIALSIAYETKSNIDNLFSSNLKFKTGEELEIHLNYVLQLLNNRKDDQNSNMLLVGYIEKHIETCVEDDCPIKVKKKKKQQFLKEMDQNCKLLIHQIQRMYNQGIKKFPQSTKLHISFAFFYMEQVHQNAKAYEEFVRAQRLSPSFIEEFIIYRFKKIIKDKLEQNKKQQNDLIQIIRFDNHVTLCQQAMIQSAKLHKQFWTELVEETPNLHKMNEIGSKIIDTGNSVKFNFQEIKKINSHSAEIIHNYGVYSMFVSQNIPQGKQCLVQSKRAYFQKLSKQQLLPGQQSSDKNEQNFSIIVNAAENGMGKIMTVSEGFIEMSGYLKQQITQKSIDKILPQIMSFYHQFVMNRWLLDSKRQYMNDESNSYFRENHRGFIKQKNGFIIPVHYRVNYNIMQQKCYVFFKNDKQLGQNLDLKIYIITDNKGVIKEISSLGFAYFNLTKENLSSNMKYIDEFGLNYHAYQYNEQGNFIKIMKNPTMRILDTSGRKGMKQEKQEKIYAESSLENKKYQTEEFLVKAERIVMPYSADEFEQQEENYNSKLKKDGKKEIGTIFMLERVVEPKIIEGQIKLQSLNVMGYQILQLYQANDNQNIDSEQDNLLIQKPKHRRRSRVQQTIEQLKMSQNSIIKERTYHNYAGRIKTYRLVNRELKRIAENYGDEDSDYDEVDEQKIALSAFEIEKLKNPLFVQKIKEAINTNIDHRQVTILKVAFSIFLVGLIAILILNYLQINKNLSSIQSLIEENMLWVKDQFFMCNLLHLVYNSTLDGAQVFIGNGNYTSSYNITFDPDVQVSLFQQDGSQKMVRLNEAMIMVQGQLINYFNNNILALDMQLMLKNYFLAVYPALQNYTAVLEVGYTPVLLYLGAMVFLSSVVVAVWIYNIMRIDLKCFDIILWFLDIPVAYVSYLQVNCNTFLKSYIPVKQLMQKGINFHDKNLYIEQFNAFESNQNQQDDKFNQDNKARKILIARYKKRTFLSHCDCGYLQLFWLLMYSMTFSLTYLLTLKTQIDFFTFMNQEWKIVTNQFLWSSMIPNNLRLINQQNVTTIGNLNIANFQKSLQNKFLNPVSTANLTNSYSKLISQGSDVTDYYLKIFEGNICSFDVYSIESVTICKNYLSGKLQGGISSVFAYYSMLDHTKYLQVQHVQYDYINGYLLSLFEVWSGVFLSSITSVGNIITLCLVLYIIVSVFGFIILWFLYLQKLNVRLNQTIQMLNMIPIRMLPKGRKDIRDFFNWIIRESNKYQVGE